MDALKIKQIFWQKEWKIPHTSWTIRGYSRSAFRTGFYIPELKLLLDAGPQNFTDPETILITHTHIDHIACLPMSLIGTIKKPDIHLPTAAISYVDNYIRSMFAVNALQPTPESDEWYTLHGHLPKDHLEMKLNKNQISVEILECDHAIPTISYGLSEAKQKLKAEYRDIAGSDLAKLRKEGHEITETITFKRFAYVCDTSIKVFDNNPTLLSYPVIMIECTFFLPDEIENSHKTAHIHWDQLRPYVEANPDTIFMLFHFSQRYRDSEIVEFFQAQNLPNLQWWTSDI